MNTTDFHKLFNPRSVAVVGISNDRTKGASGFLHALISLGYPGALYPVHPHLREIAGLKAYPRVSAIPQDVDYAIIGVPAASVPEVIGDCISKGVSFAHIFSSGFGEVGTKEGTDLQRKIVDMAKGKLRILGPNCLGVYHPRARLGFEADFPVEPGNVSFISQSGGIAIGFVDRAASENISFNKVVSIGNACDLRVTDFLQEFGSDPETEILGMYLEGLQEGEDQKFFDFVKRMTPAKPLVLWKAGHTEASARAAQSHTGSMVGSYDLWRSVARQMGAILVRSLEEMADVVSALVSATLPEGRSVGIIAYGGGTSVTATDTCTSHGLAVPPLDRHIQDKILDYIPEAGTFRSNPVDVTGWITSPRISGNVSLLVAGDPKINLIIYCLDIDFILKQTRNLGLDAERLIRGHARALTEIKETTGKTVVAVLYQVTDNIDSERLRIEVKGQLNSIGIPSFPTMERAAKALARLSEYGEYRRRFSPPAAHPRAVGSAEGPG